MMEACLFAAELFPLPSVNTERVSLYLWVLIESAQSSYWPACSDPNGHLKSHGYALYSWVIYKQINMEREENKSLE